MDEPPWKKIKLSLERPYKDDNGGRIPGLLDILPDGQHIYEPKEEHSQLLGENLRRIFFERGVDFFDKTHTRDGGLENLDSLGKPEVTDETSKDAETESESSQQTMTPEELFKMRGDILPHLFTALGEMSHAQELLSLLLSTTSTSAQNPMLMLGGQAAPTAQPISSTIAATIVNKPPPIASVQAFNSQLAIGGKDEALRKAAGVFKSAAESMERGRVRGEKYWVDALKIRRANWGLIPAPLPYGTATGKGADRSSKDFLISFGLEESPAFFRRRAIGQMPTYDTDSDTIVFPQRQRTRLRVSLILIESSGARVVSQNSIQPTHDETLDGTIRSAQQEIVEQEIFSFLVREAGSLPSASARVSERLIVIDAAQGIELKFEQVDPDALEDLTVNPWRDRCDLIYHSLHALLLRSHTFTKTERLGTLGLVRVPLHMRNPQPVPPAVLQTVIDMLQYQVFTDRVYVEVSRMGQALRAAGIASTLRFNPVGEIGVELIKTLSDISTDKDKTISGETVLRVDNRHTLRLTTVSPSSLTMHLPQSTLTLSSIPQLCQVLTQETERYLLSRICDIGRELTENVGGAWFTDPVKSRSVGRWDGCVLNFRISFEKDATICCSAFRLDSNTRRENTLLENYENERHGSLFPWVRGVLQNLLTAT